MHALASAARSGDLRSLQRSIQDAGTVGPDGRTALMHAALGGDLACISLLLPREAGILSVYGETAFSLALMESNVSAARILEPYEAGIDCFALRFSLRRLRDRGYLSYLLSTYDNLWRIFYGHDCDRIADSVLSRSSARSSALVGANDGHTSELDNEVLQSLSAGVADQGISENGEVASVGATEPQPASLGAEASNPLALSGSASSVSQQPSDLASQRTQRTQRVESPPTKGKELTGPAGHQALLEPPVEVPVTVLPDFREPQEGAADLPLPPDVGTLNPLLRGSERFQSLVSHASMDELVDGVLELGQFDWLDQLSQVAQGTQVTHLTQPAQLTQFAQLSQSGQSGQSDQSDQSGEPQEPVDTGQSKSPPKIDTEPPPRPQTPVQSGNAQSNPEEGEPPILLTPLGPAKESDSPKSDITVLAVERVSQCMQTEEQPPPITLLPEPCPSRIIVCACQTDNQEWQLLDTEVQATVSSPPLEERDIQTEESLLTLCSVEAAAVQVCPEAVEGSCQAVPEFSDAAVLAVTDDAIRATSIAPPPPLLESPAPVRSPQQDKAVARISYGVQCSPGHKDVETFTYIYDAKFEPPAAKERLLELEGKFKVREKQVYDLQRTLDEYKEQLALLKYKYGQENDFQSSDSSSFNDLEAGSVHDLLSELNEGSHASSQPSHWEAQEKPPWDNSGVSPAGSNGGASPAGAGSLRPRTSGNWPAPTPAHAFSAFESD